MLPCPGLLCLILTEMLSHIKKLLLLCGDVETNPGPGPDLTLLLKQIQQIADDVKGIKNDRLTAIESTLEKVAALDEKVSSCVTAVNKLQQSLSAMENRLDDLENRSRRSNLILYGIPENGKENDRDLAEMVNEDVIKKVLELEPVAIERIHRLGRPSANKARPIILKLLDFREKTTILKNCYKLKGLKIAVGEDFTPRVRDIRKKLWQAAKARKLEGDKINLVFDKLKINNEVFEWDDDVNCIRPVKRNPQQKNEESHVRALRPRNTQSRTK